MKRTPIQSETPVRCDEAERRLCEKLRAFDHEAWSSLFDEHREKIWRYAAARAGGPDAADDITAQVFVEALQSIQRFRYQGKPILAWLYRIARNHTGKLLREAKRPIALTPDAPPESFIDRTLDALVVAEALRLLSSEQAEVVALRFFADYSTREIVGAMGKTESAIYSLEVRAMASLRRYFAVSERSSPAADKIWASRGIER